MSTAGLSVRVTTRSDGIGGSAPFRIPDECPLARANSLIPLKNIHRKTVSYTPEADAPGALDAQRNRT